MTPERARASVRRWGEGGRLLVAQRWRELSGLSDTGALEAADALIDAALRVPLPPARRTSSGLAEQQAWFRRNRSDGVALTIGVKKYF